jgi:hypothetical protein
LKRRPARLALIENFALLVVAPRPVPLWLRLAMFAVLVICGSMLVWVTAGKRHWTIQSTALVAMLALLWGGWQQNEVVFWLTMAFCGTMPFYIIGSLVSVAP